MKKLYIFLLFFLLPLFFVLFSFFPTIYEILNKKEIPANREFTLDHNYVFDFNFYLSRIREGTENRWLVTEKYYNQTHPSSLFQIAYLYMGKIGGMAGASPTVVYHIARIVLGWMLLFCILIVLTKIWGVRKSIFVFFLIATAGSWPILVKVSEGINIGGFRSATYMGWWSSQDSLQRITYIPHVLIGQILLLLFIYRYSFSLSLLAGRGERKTNYVFLCLWGLLGLVGGIIFPPVLVITYAWFFVQSGLEIMHLLSERNRNKKTFVAFIYENLFPRFIFCLISGISFIYLQVMFKILPWSALATFDIRHRMPLPLMEYILSMGPVFDVGIVGIILVFLKREKSFYPFASWIIANFLLIALFWNIPTQSPLRFTQSAIYIPSGILTGYLFLSILKWIDDSFFKKQIADNRKKILGRGLRSGTIVLYLTIISTGFFVMVSMAGWLCDQVYAKRVGTFPYPTGAEIIYPTKDFMNGIYFIRNETNSDSVVLASETAGNFIPAYAGNYVYYGHANTPDDDMKKQMIEKFFSGRMSEEEAWIFLTTEKIKYVYCGPQENELTMGKSLGDFYPYLRKIYQNQTVTIYKIGEAVSN